MLEIEAKFPLPDRTPVETKLRDWGGLYTERRRDADYYFNAPDRDFATTDESFRLRCIGEKNYLTYKGPKRDTETKTRTELEIPIAPGEAIATDMQQMLTFLGYRFVTIVRKSREVMHLRRGGYDLHVCFDDVDEVGSYIELEIVADESHYETAKAVLLQTAKELELHEQERTSYLQLLLRKRGQ